MESPLNPLFRVNALKLRSRLDFCFIVATNLCLKFTNLRNATVCAISLLNARKIVFHVFWGWKIIWESIRQIDLLVLFVVLKYFDTWNWIIFKMNTERHIKFDLIKIYLLQRIFKQIIREEYAWNCVKIISHKCCYINFLKIDKNHYKKTNRTIWDLFKFQWIFVRGKFQAFVSSWIDVIYSL